jgi:hypothetical protein
MRNDRGASQGGVEHPRTPATKAGSMRPEVLSIFAASISAAIVVSIGACGHEVAGSAPDSSTTGNDGDDGGEPGLCDGPCLSLGGPCEGQPYCGLGAIAVQSAGGTCPAGSMPFMGPCSMCCGGCVISTGSQYALDLDPDAGTCPSHFVQNGPCCVPNDVPSVVEASIVTCGNGTCDLSTRTCCAGPQGSACVRKGATCPAETAAFGCLQATDCDGGEICCLLVGSAIGASCESVSEAGFCPYPSQGASAQLCQTVAECGDADWCDSVPCVLGAVSGDLSLCGRGLRRVCPNGIALPRALDASTLDAPLNVTGGAASDAADAE